MAKDTLKYIKKKYDLRYQVPMPIVLPIDRENGLTELFNELGFKVGAEIGTSKGRYAKWLLLRVKGLKLYCVDPWEIYDDYVEYNNKETKETCDNFFEQTKERLDGLNAVLIRKFSMDAVKDFEDNSLDFVFIDGNHSFEYAVEDIAKWEKKVRIGGIVSGHDFWRSIELKKVWVDNPTAMERLKLCQVKDAVLGWTFANQIKPWFVLNSNKNSSWFWVKN